MEMEEWKVGQAGIEKREGRGKKEGKESGIKRDRIL